jgi:hypothetical protein
MKKIKFVLSDQKFTFFDVFKGWPLAPGPRPPALPLTDRSHSDWLDSDGIKDNARIGQNLR